MTKTEGEIPERSLPQFLEQLGISIGFRIANGLNADAEGGARLEAVFKGIASFSWTQDNNLAQQFIDAITNCTEERWLEGVIGCLALNADLNTAAIKLQHPEHPDIIGWCPMCKARLALTCFNPNIPHGDSIIDFAVWTRQFFLELLAKGAKNLISPQWLDGIFTTNLAASRETINELLVAIGGDELLDDISEVARNVHKELSKEPVIRLVLELIEGVAKITISTQDSGATLNMLTQSSYRHLRNLGFTLPGTYEINDETKRRTFGEVKLQIEDSIIDNLMQRIQTDPERLVRDSLDHTLHAWLMKAVRNDFLDRIDFLKAKGRDVTREVSLDAPIHSADSDGGDNDDVDSLADLLPSSSPDPADETIANDAVERIMTLFNPLELKILGLITKGLNTAEIATHFGHSFKWAKRKVDGIRAKAAKWREGEEVAKVLPKDPGI